MNGNLTEESDLKINTTKGRIEIFHCRSKPSKGLSITLICLARHENPCNRDEDLETSIKNHDDKALVEWMGYTIKGGINKHMDLGQINHMRICYCRKKPRGELQCLPWVIAVG